MKCKILDCIRHEDCGFLDILRKQPISAQKCSYFKNEKQAEKEKNRQVNDNSSNKKQSFKKKNRKK